MTPPAQHLRILFAGTTDNAAETLSYLVNANMNVVGVLTRLDAPTGRKATLTPSPVAVRAVELGLPLVKSNRVDAEALEEIAQTGANLGVVVAYGSLLKRAALDALKFGWLNVHFSLLPKYRGAAPVQHAILNGDLTTGVSIFRLNEGMDTGPLLATRQVQIDQLDDSGSLLSKLTKTGCELLDEALAGDMESAVFAEQSQQDASFAPKIGRSDAEIQFEKRDSGSVLRIVRAMKPEPMAWSLFQGQPLRILEAGKYLGEAPPPGAISLADGKVIVGCAVATAIELLHVQPAGKKGHASV